MIQLENFSLSNGVKIPKVGLGTWEINNDLAPKAIKDAVDVGYRHFDSAQGYQNEEGVGIGIRKCGENRENLFITTKLDASVKTYNETLKSIDDSLNRLQLDYIDLMLIHSPKPWDKFLENELYLNENKEVWRAFEIAYSQGKLRSIGVSNFSEIDLQNIFESCSVKPMVNQILAHISNTPQKLIEYCHSNNILVEAYSPMAHGELFKNQLVTKIASKYNVSVAQLAIKYCLQLGMLPLPKSGNIDNMKNNIELDFEISPSDMNLLLGIEQIKDYGEFGIFPVFKR